jgi:hypothetical protein
MDSARPDLTLPILLSVVGGYLAWVAWLKRSIQKVDPRTLPLVLQPRDFGVVRRARDSATTDEERRRLEKLLSAMWATVASMPLLLLLPWVLQIRCV